MSFKLGPYRSASYFAMWLLVLINSSPLHLHAQSAAKIEVNAAEVLGPVNRLVFGQNIDAADNAYIFSSDKTDLNLIQRGDGFWDPNQAAPIPEVVQLSKAAGMSMLRYPGGCLAHNFDWRKTVGPEAKKNGWLFGLDEFMTLCQAIGATPLITLSDYALPAGQMQQNAAELVEYLNAPADAAHPWAIKRRDAGHAAPYHVTWFEVGNESMHGNHRVTPHRQFSAEEYAAFANATMAAARKVDPQIKLGIVLVPGPGNDVDCDWNRTVVHLAGANADFAVIHMYAPLQLPADTPASLRMQAMMAAPEQVEQHLIEYHTMIQKQLGRDLPLAVTEFNGSEDRNDDRLTYGDALECADLLRVFLKPQSHIVLANYWQFLNGPFGMLRTSMNSSSKAVANKEPAFFLYALWTQHFGSQLVKAEVQGPRADSPGAGSEMAATGTASAPRQLIQRVDLDQYTSFAGTLWPRLLNVQIERQSSDWTIHLTDLSRNIYPTLAKIPRPETNPGGQLEFTVSFDARFTPESGSETAPMGIGLTDSRGWNQTHSGIGVDDISGVWKHLEGTYRLDPATSTVDLTARLMANGKHVSGTLLIHNLTVTEFAAAHAPAYPLLTTSASLSSDGRRLYVVVLNKSASDSIPTTLHLANFPASTAKYWEVNGPTLASSAGVTETVQGVNIPVNETNTIIHSFPAHSMTAIEVTGSQERIRDRPPQIERTRFF